MPTDLLATQDPNQDQGASAGADTGPASTRDLLSGPSQASSGPSWGSMALNAIAGAGESLTSLGGLALDAVNPVHHIARMVDDTSKLISGQQILPDQPHAGPWINQQLGRVGLNPEDVKPHNWQERMARNVGAGATSVIFPGGPVRNLIMGTMGGVGQTVGGEWAHEYAPQYQGEAELAGSLIGGGLASVPSMANRALGRWVDAGPNAAQHLQDFRDAGVRAPAGAVADNPSLRSFEAGVLSRLPGAGHSYYGPQGEYTQATQDLENRVGELSTEYGDPQGKGVPTGVRTPEDISTLIAKGATAAGQAVRNRESNLYEAALKPVAGMTAPPRSMTDLENLSRDWTDALSQNPRSLPYTKEALARVNNILKDVADGSATIDSLRRVRTDIGRELSDPVIVGVSSAQSPYLKQMYEGLSNDITTLASRLDPTGTVAKDLATANRYTRLVSGRLNTVQDVMGGKMNGQLYQAMMSSGQTGGATLRAFRNTLKPEEWDAVAGTTLGRLGLAKPGAQAASGVADMADTFSPTTFMTNWSKLQPEAKQALFGGTRYANLVPKLDRLSRVAGQLEDLAKAGAGSPTAYRSAHVRLMQGVAAAAGAGFMSGDPLTMIMAPVGVAAVGYGIPKLMAKSMTNPGFVDWMIRRAAARTPAAVARTTALFHTMAATNPVMSAWLTRMGHAGWRANGTTVEYYDPSQQGANQ